MTILFLLMLKIAGEQEFNDSLFNQPYMYIP